MAVSKLCGISSAMDRLTIDDSNNLVDVLIGESKPYVQEGRVMFIMRGVPGAGKSTIVRQLTKEFHTKCICSADDYFSRDGTYKFDKSKISEAHRYSQDSAKRYCEEGQKVIIIDNTHVKRWEMEPYRKLAHEHSYVIFTVIPSGQFTTPPEVLARRNKHGVDAETIERKLKDFQKHKPYYYGWFFNTPNTDSINMIKRTALDIYKRHIGTPPVFDDAMPLHVTSTYLGHKGAPLERLDKHIGCVDGMKIKAVVVSQRTMAALVELDDAAFEFYDNDDDFSDMAAEVGRGYGAHITLGTVQAAKSVDAKADSITARQCMRHRKGGKIVEKGLVYNFPEHQLTVIRIDGSIKGIFSYY